MARQTSVVELAALRAELEKPAPAPGRPATVVTEPPPAERSESRLQIEQFVQELQSALDEVTEDTEDLIAEHPLPSVAAAFLLGLAVGWLTARG
jgi:ElaB/YqjD/DUF883 family membrane-anchored ribosome-binding protein